MEEYLYILQALQHFNYLSYTCEDLLQQYTGTVSEHLLIIILLFQKHTYIILKKNLNVAYLKI